MNNTEESKPSVLAGKTIIKAVIKGIADVYDDEPYLILTMKDGSTFRVVSCYGGYTGCSEDEYPNYIRVERCD